MSDENKNEEINLDEQYENIVKASENSEVSTEEPKI
jgi:hypothetical protein